MNRRTLTALAIAAALALLAAIVLQHSQRPASDTGEQSARLVPELHEHVNDVGKVIVTGAGGTVLATLDRGVNGWTLAEKGGYAVDTGKLRDLLLKLADARTLEQKTANRDRYAALGVEDVSAKDAKGVLLELDGLAQPVKLIVGNAGPRGNGSFVRRADEAQSWLVSPALTIEKNPADWLRKDLADIAASRVASVSITRPDGSHVGVHKEAEGDASFRLDEVPKGREPAEAFTLDAPASMLAGLRFDDVLPARDAMPPEDALKARFALFDGIVIDVTAWPKDGRDFAQFTASLDAARADQGITAAQAKARAEFEAASTKADAEKKPDDAPVKPLAVSDPAKDRAGRLASVNQELAALQARFSGWTYVLPAYKYASIDKPPDDFLKPLEPKKPPAAAKPAKPAAKG